MRGATLAERPTTPVTAYDLVRPRTTSYDLIIDNKTRSTIHP